MKRCLLFALSFVLLSIGLSTGHSSNVSAVSTVDDVIQVTDDIKVYSPTGSWSIANDPTKLIDYINGELLIRRYGSQGNGGVSQSHNDIINSKVAVSAILDGSYSGKYAILQFQNGVNIVYNDNPIDGEYTWATNYLRIDHNAQAGWKSVQLSSYEYSAGEYGLRWWYRDGSFFNQGFGYSNYIAYDDNISVYSSNITDIEYPVGYEGLILGDIVPTPQITEHKPNITWSVDDDDVTVYSDSAKNTAILDDYQIYWFISNTTTNMVQPSEPFALSGCTPPDYNNNFTVPIHFDYGVQAYYADENCNILQLDNEGNTLTDNMVVLTVDGSTFDGSTTDHVAIIGEIEESAIVKAIRQFKPNDGGLAGLIYAPIEAVATLPTIVGSCSPITLPLLGENIQLQCIRPTIQASPMGPVYTTISVIITGIVTWWVAWKTFGIIKNIQDPQDDRVEVLKL